MNKDHVALAADLNKEIAELRRGQPEMMTAFSSLARLARADGALDAKTRETIAIARAQRPRGAPQPATGRARALRGAGRR